MMRDIFLLKKKEGFDFLLKQCMMDEDALQIDGRWFEENTETTWERIDDDNKF